MFVGFRQQSITHSVSCRYCYLSQTFLCRPRRDCITELHHICPQMSSFPGVPLTSALVVVQFFPRTAPPDGRAEMTLCGWEFQSPFRPQFSRKTHRVNVGRTPCTVLPRKSSSTQSVKQTNNPTCTESHGHTWGTNILLQTKIYLTFRLVCQIGAEVPGESQPFQSITLEVDEGIVEGRYSIQGRAQIDGFSFVVMT